LPRSTGTSTLLFRLALIVCVVGIAAFAVATVVLFVRPHSDAPRPADAVVVLGPGLNGERLQEGVRLMRQKRGRVLVISKARDPNWTDGKPFCSGASGLKVVCFMADPYTTQGEARAIARLSSKYGWRSVLVVTSTYHVTRARLLTRRCDSLRVEVVGASPNANVLEWAAKIGHEWGGLANALTFARKC
jgi:hypothetical protein